MRRAAFTLVELLIVIIVLAVLAAIVVPKFTQSGDRSKQAARSSNLKVLKGAVGRFYDDTGAYPTTRAALAATSAPATGLSSAGGSRAISSGSWNGPYIERVLNDPVTNTAYIYGTASPTVGQVSAPAVAVAVSVGGGVPLDEVP